MRMKTKKTGDTHRRGGFTLIECLIAVVVIMVVMGAVMTFRYYTVGCAERAENQLLAVRSAYLLSEAWRGQKADPAFDPTNQDFDSDFQIDPVAVPATFGGFHAGSYFQKLQGQAGLTKMGDYRIQIDDKQFWTRLWYGASTVPNLRALHVLIVWRDHQGRQYEYYLPTLSQT